MDWKNRSAYVFIKTNKGTAETVWKKTGDLSQVASALGHTRLKSTIRYSASLLEDTSETKEKGSADVFPRVVSV